MKYHLSNRQLKELANGKLLRIALPHPAEEVADPLAWARQHLDVRADYILLAEVVDLPVNPLTRGERGLAGVIGAICHADAMPDWSVEIVCIVCDVAAKPTRGTYPTQWPKSVTLDSGKVIGE